MRRKKTGALWIALIGAGTFVAFTILSFAINDPGPFVAGVLLVVILLPISMIVFLAGRIRSRREAKYGARKPRAAYVPPRSRVSTSDDVRAGMAWAKAYQSQQLQVTQKKTAAPQSVRRTYQFCVAGINSVVVLARLPPEQGRRGLGQGLGQVQRH